MTDREVQKLVTILVTAFASQCAKLTHEQQEAQQTIYRRMLADLDYAAASAAVERIIATQRFMPAIAEIREACLHVTIGPPRAGLEAWGEVITKIGHYGIYRVPGVDFNFDDPVTARCVAAIGWVNLCNSEMPEAARARFIDAYEQLVKRERANQNTGQLPAAQRYAALMATRDNKTAAAAGSLLSGIFDNIGRIEDDGH